MKKIFLTIKNNYHFLLLLFACVLSTIIYIKFNGRLFSIKHDSLLLLSSILLFQTITWVLVRKHINTIWIVLPVFGILCGPIFSADSYFYIDKFYQLIHLGQNPYYTLSLVPNTELPYFNIYKDSFFAYTKLIYGPVWLLIGSLSVLFSKASTIIPFIIQYKILSAVFVGGISFLIYKFSGDKKYAIWYAVAPIVVFELIIDAHNDAMMIFFIVLSLLLMKKKYIVWASMAFVGALLVKYSALLLLPFFGLYIIKNRLITWKSFIGIVIGATVLVLGFYAPFFRDFHMFDGFLEFARGGHVLSAGILGYIMTNIFSLSEITNTLIKAISFIIIFSIIIFITRKKFSIDSYIYSSIFVYIFFGMIMTYWAMPWYLTLPFTLLFFLENPKMRNTLIYTIICIWLIFFATQYSFIGSSMLFMLCIAYGVFRITKQVNTP